jgi:hypothetical protein
MNIRRFRYVPNRNVIMNGTRFASSCCEMLPHSSIKAPASSRTFLGGMALALTLRSNRVPDVLNRIEIRALRWPWQNTDIPVLQEIMHRMSSMAGGIVMLEGHVRMSLQEGCHMREEDVHDLSMKSTFTSPLWSSDGGFVPIFDVVAGDVW